MKKTILSFLFAASAISLYAQKGLHIGVIGGAQSVAHLNKQDSDDANVRYAGQYFRAAFGPTINYHFNDKIGVGTQILFSYQGLRYENWTGVEVKRKTNYVKVPLLFHANSSSSHVVGGYVYLGPQFSFNTGNDIEATGISLKSTNSVAHALYSDAHKNVVIGGVLGFGMLFNIGIVQPHFGLRLDGDITSALDNSKAAATTFFPADALGNRSATRNVSGLIEIGVKVVLFGE